MKGAVLAAAAMVLLVPGVAGCPSDYPVSGCGYCWRSRAQASWGGCSSVSVPQPPPPPPPPPSAPSTPWWRRRSSFTPPSPPRPSTPSTPWWWRSSPTPPSPPPPAPRRGRRSRNPRRNPSPPPSRRNPSPPPSRRNPSPPPSRRNPSPPPPRQNPPPPPARSNPPPPRSGGGGGGSSSGYTSSSLFREMTQANCIDGKYQEAFSSVNGNIESIMQRLQPQGSIDHLVSVMLDVLDVRYPYGAHIIRTASNVDGKKCSHYWMGSSKNTWSNMNPSNFFQAVDLCVHECGHTISNDNSQYRSQAHFLAKGKEFTCSIRGSREYPALHNLENDRWSRDVPGNTYDNTYIDQGSPVGDQGWESVMDEAVQYSHTLVDGYTFYQYTTYGSSADGALSFVWYIQRYLYFLKQNNRGIFDEIVNDSCWRETILSLWGRVWAYEGVALSLNQPSNEDNLTSERTQKFVNAIKKPELMEMIETLRRKEGC